MPTYDYVCDKCGHEFETFQSMKADVLTECPECNENALRRLIGMGAGIIFKGSGFYETDYKKKTDPEKEKKSESSESKDSKATKDGGSSKDSGSSKDGGSTKKDSSKSTSTKSDTSET